MTCDQEMSSKDIPSGQSSCRNENFQDSGIAGQDNGSVVIASNANHSAAHSEVRGFVGFAYNLN